jgi:hypothetical protein
MINIVMGKGIANTNDTLDDTIRTHPDPFQIMDAIWMLAAEAKPHTHSAIAEFG